MAKDTASLPAGPGAQISLSMLKRMAELHVFINRLSGGRFFNTLQGRDVCFVTMTGARSGRKRTIPLMYLPYKEGILLVASQGGAHKNPAWYYNLVHNGDIEVTHRGRRMKLRARLAGDDEKAELWPICDEYYPQFADYRARTTRDFPIFVCEPRG